MALTAAVALAGGALLRYLDWQASAWVCTLWWWCGWVGVVVVVGGGSHACACVKVHVNGWLR